jgi:hypothetical protein
VAQGGQNAFKVQVSISGDSGDVPEQAAGHMLCPPKLDGWTGHADFAGVTRWQLVAA